VNVVCLWRLFAKLTQLSGGTDVAATVKSAGLKETPAMKTEALFRFTAAHRRFTFAAAALAVLALPIAAHAQGVIRGMEGGANEGAYRGNRAAGPVGGAVGGAVGAGVGGIVGGVNGVLGIDNRRSYRHRHYRHRRHR
jgi:hypothetical protein